MTHQLNTHEESIIVAALLLAADQYTRDAAIMEQAGMRRMAEQFTEQAREASQLAERMAEQSIAQARERSMLKG